LSIGIKCDILSGKACAKDVVLRNR